MSDLSDALYDPHRLSRVLLVMLQEARGRGIGLERAYLEGSRHVREIEAARSGPLRGLAESLCMIEGELSGWHGVALPPAGKEGKLKAAERDGRMRPLNPAAFWRGPGWRSRR